MERAVCDNRTGLRGIKQRYPSEINGCQRKRHWIQDNNGQRRICPLSDLETLDVIQRLSTNVAYELKPRDQFSSLEFFSGGQYVYSSVFSAGFSLLLRLIKKGVA